ncbi:MAG: HNH endonuclease [Pseudonocardia sp.]|nr:HNH endonuclease [Pseudonocardia sp.]
MTVTLVLNATYEPLCVVPLRRAVVLVLAEKATVLETGEGLLRSERMQLAAPSVVRLSRYVRVPYRQSASLTRKAVMERDRHRCAYCTRRADTLDHVVPRSRGGDSVWENVVTSCATCNHKKGNRLLHEVQMVMRVHPRPPTPVLFIQLAAPKIPDRWRPYLPEIAAA